MSSIIEKRIIDLVVSFEDWKDIFEKQKDLAREGNATAVNFLVCRRFGTAIPKPTKKQGGQQISITFGTDAKNEPL